MTIAKQAKKPWIVSSAREVAEFFVVSLRTVSQDWRARGMPGEKGHYDLSAIHAWRVKDLDRKAKPAAKDDSGDSFLDGAESPGLERYRLAKAALAELQLERQHGQVIDRTAAHQAFSLAADHLRDAGQRLQKQFGSDAFAVLDEALNEVDRELEAVFCGIDGGGDKERDS